MLTKAIICSPQHEACAKANASQPFPIPYPIRTRPIITMQCPQSQHQYKAIVPISRRHSPRTKENHNKGCTRRKHNQLCSENKRNQTKRQRFNRGDSTRDQVDVKNSVVTVQSCHRFHRGSAYSRQEEGNDKVCGRRFV